MQELVQNLRLHRHRQCLSFLLSGKHYCHQDPLFRQIRHRQRQEVLQFHHIVHLYHQIRRHHRQQNILLNQLDPEFHNLGQVVL